MKDKTERLIWTLVDGCNHANIAIRYTCCNASEIHLGTLYEKFKKHTCDNIYPFKGIYNSLEKLSQHRVAGALKQKVNIIDSRIYKKTSIPGFPSEEDLKSTISLMLSLCNDLEKIANDATSMYIKQSEKKKG